MKKIKRTGKIGIFLLFIIVVIFRWFQLNNGNHGKYDIAAEDQTVTVNGLQHSIIKSQIYEMPAIVEKNPELKEYYSYVTNHYVKNGLEKAFNSLKYVVYIEMKVKNTSNTAQEITFSDYYVTCENQSVLQGGFPDLIQKLNDGYIDKKLQPQEEITIKMCYDIIGENIANLTYEKLKAMRLMIPVSGYPKPKAISIHNAALVKSTGEFDPYNGSKDKTADQKENVPEDTKTGSVLPVGDRLIESGVGYQLEDVVIVEKFEDFKEYNPDAWLGYYKSRFIKKDGSFTTVAEDRHGLRKSYYTKGYKDYAIFVKLCIKNYTSADKSLYNCFDLYNNKRTLEGPCDPEYISTLDIDNEKDVYKGYISAGEEQELVLGYTRSIRNDHDIYTMPLYISNDYDENVSDFDLSKGKGGFGRYLRIQ